MRRIPIAPLVLIAAIGVWAYLYNTPACLVFWNDLCTLAGSAIHGKFDSAAGKTVLADLGTTVKGAAMRSAHDLHIPLGPAPSNHAVVIIKGDAGEGTGFLVKSPEGPAVVTNYHVIAANPHFRVLADDGSEIPVTSIRGASDRDIALLGIPEGNYSFLDLEKNVTNSAEVGDDDDTLGNSQGGEVTLTTPGKVKAVGPERVEIDNPIYHGNSGGPVFDEDTGKVIGVATMAFKRAPDDFIDTASRANPASAITSDVRYFALRLDNVPRWDTYDMKEVARQTAFIRQFKEDTRSLDSYLNGSIYEKRGLVAKGAPDSSVYKKNPLLGKLPDSQGYIYKTVAQVRDMPDVGYAIDDCERFAKQDMDAIQNPHNFYAFEWMQAQIAADQRARLIKELDYYKKLLGLY